MTVLSMFQSTIANEFEFFPKDTAHVIVNREIKELLYPILLLVLSAVREWRAMGQKATTDEYRYFEASTNFLSKQMKS